MDIEINGKKHEVDLKKIDSMLDALASTTDDSSLGEALGTALSKSNLVHVDSLEPPVLDTEFEDETDDEDSD